MKNNTKSQFEELIDQIYMLVQNNVTSSKHTQFAYDPLDKLRATLSMISWLLDKDNGVWADLNSQIESLGEEVDQLRDVKWELEDKIHELEQEISELED